MRTVEQRFWSKVEETETCWLWTASTNPGGYGKFGVSGPGWTAAHRVSYEMANGPIESGLFVLHTCDNPPCVNPDHLFLGTAKDNAVDMASKGRARSQKITECTKGHPYSDENTYVHQIRGSWKRRCKTCHHQQYLERRARMGYAV